jgi:hypothetical protein
MAFWKKWFGTSGTQKQAAEVARQEAERARRIQEAALTNPADSEQSRSAGERRLRRLGALRGISGARTGAGGTGMTQQKTLLGG